MEEERGTQRIITGSRMVVDILNPGGGPTPDKPDISVVDYEFDSTLSIFMNLRVADI